MQHLKVTMEIQYLMACFFLQRAITPEMFDFKYRLLFCSTRSKGKRLFNVFVVFDKKCLRGKITIMLT